MQEKIEAIISKIRDNKDFADEFKENPVKAIESVLGTDLPDELINNIISGVKAKLAADDAGGLLGSIKKLF